MTGENTIESRMRSKIMGWERGQIFFLEEFDELGDPVSVRQFICGMVSDGFVIRLARGIYCYPRLSSSEYGLATIIKPDSETIAYALAARENVRITPYGDQAAYKLGLSSMYISSQKYLTDGSPRVVHLAADRKIYFNHTSEVKIFAFRNENMQMLSSALRAMGKDYFDDPGRRRKVHEILRAVPENEFNNDIKIPPAWVGRILLDIWNN